MKTTLLPEQISRIVRLAWGDRTSFEEIEKRTGFVEREVISVILPRKPVRGFVKESYENRRNAKQVCAAI